MSCSEHVEIIEVEYLGGVIFEQIEGFLPI